MFVKDYLPYYKRNLKIAFPVMLTQLGASLVGLFDTIMVGHYATADLAAVSFSNAIFFTIMVFAMGMLMGLTPLVGYEVGKMGVEEERSRGVGTIGGLFYNGFVVAIGLSVVMCLILGSVYPFLDKFGQDPEVIEAARGYFLLMTISIVPFLFFCLQKQFLEGLGNTWVAMLITFAMNLLNIFLNWILIFGHCGFAPMGATGAGIATLISRTLMPLCFFVVIAGHRQWKAYLKGNRINKDVMARLIKIGTPIGMQTFLETFTFTLS
ncbi:MAG: MATE family efflux transporter, partial [Bacteroidales bacterium]|nr:MATE family efflux transporter [Bacteroidales bacterium]